MINVLKHILKSSEKVLKQIQESNKYYGCDVHLTIALDELNCMVVPLIKEAIAEVEKNEPIGKICLNCGSSWSDKRLTREKEKNLYLIACCPDRKMVDVYTHPQPKQEPFGFFHVGKKEWESEFYLFSESGDVSCKDCIKLYTHPLKQEPLTDEMTRQMKLNCDSAEMRGAFVNGWRSAEKAHGIGE